MKAASLRGWIKVTATSRRSSFTAWLIKVSNYLPLSKLCFCGDTRPKDIKLKFVLTEQFSKSTKYLLVQNSQNFCWLHVEHRNWELKHCHHGLKIYRITRKHICRHSSPQYKYKNSQVFSLCSDIDVLWWILITFSWTRFPATTCEHHQYHVLMSWTHNV